MKKVLSLIVVFLFACLITASCQRTSSQTWENMKTADSFFNHGYDDSRLINDSRAFIGPEDADFIALNEKELKTQFAISDKAIPQPRYSPGDKGSPIGSLGDFKKPEGKLADLFKNLHFDTDDHVLRSKEDLATLHQMADYLKRNPRVYLTVEGHCDERASAAYNMALGARRANHVRVLLIKNGIDFNRIYTISHGKEKPLALGHGSDDWSANRRVEFRLYAK